MTDSNTPNSNSKSTPAKKIKKPQGPIRWNAIIPFVIVMALIYAYFHFFFDNHLKSAIEWGGYKALGTEVNVAEIKTSFTEGRFEVKKLEITHAVKPEFNSIELTSIRWDVNWDALLRLKFVVQEAAVEGIQFMSKRARVGKVAPPDPEEKADGPSFTKQLQDKALNKLEKENQSNVLGDISTFLKTGSWDAQIQNLQGQLASKKLLEDMNLKWTTKRTEWDARVKALPTTQEINNFKTRFEAIKYRDFKTPQELDASVKQYDALFKELDARNKQVNEFKSQLEADLKGLDQDYKSVDAQIKKDIDTLKTKFQIPKIDAASFAKSLFFSYLTPIMSKLDHYKAMAQKYLPPKYSRMLDKKNKDASETTSKADDTIQPHPRAEGMTYEFPVKNGYPLVWIQKVSISSKSTAQADYGDFAGLIENITSNQRQIGKVTTLNINGDFKKMNVLGIKINSELNNLGEDPLVKFLFNVGSFPMLNLELLKSKDGEISIPQSTASFASSGQTIGFKNYDLNMNTTFSNVKFAVAAADKTVNEVLTGTLSQIPEFNVEASASGELSDLNLDIRSSLGGALQTAFGNLLKAKIAEANEQLQKAVNNEIEKLRGQLTSQTDAIKNQVNGEVAKAQNQINDQKKQVEERINTAKKDLENKAKQQIEAEGQKQLDALKKKFGL